MEMVERDLTTELWREYEFSGVTYRINNPQKLFFRSPDGTTHRVLDSDGVVHCVPCPGEYGCVLRWKNKDPNKPCEF